MTEQAAYQLQSPLLADVAQNNAVQAVRFPTLERAVARLEQSRFSGFVEPADAPAVPTLCGRSAS